MRALLTALVLSAGPAAAVKCDDITFDAASYTICVVDAGTEDLALYHSDTSGCDECRDVPCRSRARWAVS